MEHQQATKETPVYQRPRDQQERHQEKGSSGVSSSSPSGRRARYYDEAKAQRQLITTMMKQQECMQRLRLVSAQEIRENQRARELVPPGTIISAGKQQKGDQQDPNFFSSNHSAVSSMGDTYADRDPAPCNPPFVETVKEKVNAQIKALPAFLANLAERTTTPPWMDCRAITMSTGNCSATKMFSDEGPCRRPVPFVILSDDGPCSGPIPYCVGAAKEGFHSESIIDDTVVGAAAGGEDEKSAPRVENTDDDSLLDTTEIAEITDDEGANDDEHDDDDDDARPVPPPPPE